MTVKIYTGNKPAYNPVGIEVVVPPFVYTDGFYEKIVSVNGGR